MKTLYGASFKGIFLCVCHMNFCNLEINDKRSIIEEVNI